MASSYGFAPPPLLNHIYRIIKRQHTPAAHSLTRLLVVTAADGGRGSATRFMVRPRASDSTQARVWHAGRECPIRRQWRQV